MVFLTYKKNWVNTIQKNLNITKCSNCSITSIILSAANLMNWAVILFSIWRIRLFLGLVPRSVEEISALSALVSYVCSSIYFSSLQLQQNNEWRTTKIPFCLFLYKKLWSSSSTVVSIHFISHSMVRDSDKFASFRHLIIFLYRWIMWQ